MHRKKLSRKPNSFSSQPFSWGTIAKVKLEVEIPIGSNRLLEPIFFAQ
jgi:hypothetical protein